MKPLVGTALFLTFISTAMFISPSVRGAPGSHTTYRDSAGIEIVESFATASVQSNWTIESKPLVDIGVATGAPEYMLANVAGVLRTRSGRIFAAEFHPARILLYDSVGKHDTTMMRQGEGPGEVDLVSRVHPYRGDSILIFGGRVNSQETVLVLDANGRYGRTIKMAPPPRPSPSGARTATSMEVGFQGTTADGSFIIRGSSHFVLTGRPGQVWQNSPYYRVSADGRQNDSIAVLPTRDIEEAPSDPVGYKLPFFGRAAPVAAIHDQWMYWGNGDRFEISVFDVTHWAAGGTTPTRIIRHNRPNPPATVAVRARYEDLSLKSARSAADTVRLRTRNATHPSRSSVMAFGEIRVDAIGNVWAKHWRMTNNYRLPDDPSEPNVWTVFTAAGALIGDVTTPPNLEVTQIGTDWILGIWKDEDGVQHLRMHRIAKRS